MLNPFCVFICTHSRCCELPAFDKVPEVCVLEREKPAQILWSGLFHSLRIKSLRRFSIFFLFIFHTKIYLFGPKFLKTKIRRRKIKIETLLFISFFFFFTLWVLYIHSLALLYIYICYVLSHPFLTGVFFCILGIILNSVIFSIWTFFLGSSITL